MEPYVTDEAEEEARPGAFRQASVLEEPPAPSQQPPPEQPYAPAIPRRQPSQPVRFANPVTGSGEGSTSRRRPFRRTPRDRPPPEDPAERAGRERSPFLRERGRQSTSPSALEDISARGRRPDREESPATHTKERLRSSSSDSPPVHTRDDRTTRATTLGRRGSDDIDDAAFYMPSYSRHSRGREPGGARRSSYLDDDEDNGVRGQWDGPNPFTRSSEHQHGYFSRPPRPRMSGDYNYDEEVDVRVQTGRPEFSRLTKPAFEPAPLPRPRPLRGTTRYESEDELEFRVRKAREDYVIERERPYRPAPYLVPAYKPRTTTLGDSYETHLPPRPYPRHIYPLIPHRRSITYDEEDDVDYRVRRKPGPYLVDQRHKQSRPTRHNIPPSNYLIPAISGPQRSRKPPSPSVSSVTLESDDKNYRETTRYRKRARSRSSTPSLPNAPVIINNRVYNDSEDDHYQARLSRLDAPDLGLVPEAYPFSLSRHNKSLQGADSILSLGSDISDEEPTPKIKSAAGKTYHVLRSQYVGDGVIGGSHAVQLSITPDPSPDSTKDVASVFRWIHFEDKTMDFDNFEHNVLSIAGLTDSEISGIAKTLGRVRKSHDKPLQTSAKVKTRYMAPSFLQENLSGQKRPAASKARTISWFCAPYFCLEKYATPPGLKASSHPMMTLLQTRFALVEKERDMKQAVCYLQNTPSQHCFHIAQVWFLILDDSLVVSCARLPITSMQGDLISVLLRTNIRPFPNSPNMIVSTKSSLLWAIPLEQCQTWFGFVSLFWDYWPLQVEIKYKEKQVTASEWPRLVALAKKTTVRLVVDFRPFVEPEPVKGILLYGEDSTQDGDANSGGTESCNPTGTGLSLGPTDHTSCNKSTKMPTIQVLDEFHVFTWLNSHNESQKTSTGTSAMSIDYLLSGFESQGLKDDLTEIDAYLSKETSLSHRLTYNRCPAIHSRSKSTIYDAVSDLKPDALSTEEHAIACYETVVDVLNAAETLFRFFLPPGFDGPTTPKFWGAILRLFKSMPRVRQVSLSNDRGLTSADRDAFEVLDWLNVINKSTVPFKDYLSHVPLTNRSDVQLPNELTTAWLHLVLALTFCVEDMRLFDSQMTTCNELIDQGIQKVIFEHISKVELSNYAVFLPFEFASLVAFQLSRDQNGSITDISDTYLEYLKTLQSDVEGNPLDRSHQDRIVLLKQEIDVISETLYAQQHVLKQTQRGFGVSREGARKDADIAYPMPSHDQPGRKGRHVLPADSGGVQSIIIQDNLALVESRIKDFREMREIASELGEWNIQKIDSNKDRQEAAIYAFTIVTIIFLPLGTVAGIMGMNTSDVRDMPFGQWVYWATAIPLTIVVIALCLSWAGELNNFQKGFKNLWRKNPQGYAVMKEPYGREGRVKRYHGGGTFNRPRRSNTVYVNEGNYV